MRRFLLTLVSTATLMVPSTALAGGACDPAGPAPGAPVIGDREGDASLYYVASAGDPSLTVGQESRRGYVQVDGDTDGVAVHGSSKPDGATASYSVSVGANGPHYCLAQGDEILLEGP